MDKKGLDFNQNNIYRTYKLKYTQTELNGPESCESCDLACNIIKSLIYQMRSIASKYNIDSDVEKQIENIKKTIYELSQWTAMQEWSRALLSDMQKIIKFIDAIDIERNVLDQQYHDKVIEFNQLEEKYQLVNMNLSKKNKKEDSKYETLQKTHAEITRKNTFLTDKLYKLEKLIHEYKQKIENNEINKIEIINNFENKLKIQTNESANNINQLNETIQNNLHIIEKLTERNTQLQNEQTTINKKYQTELADLSMMLSRKNEEVVNLKQCNNELDNLKKNFEQKLEDGQRKIIDLENTLKEANANEDKLRLQIEVLEIKCQEIDTSDVHSDQQPFPIQLSGNPLEDMKKKININEKQIQVLNKQNDTLRNTIDKLSKMIPTFKS